MASGCHGCWKRRNACFNNVSDNVSATESETLVMLRVVYFSDGGVQALSDFLQFTLFMRRAGYRCPGRGVHILPVKSARFVFV